MQNPFYAPYGNDNNCCGDAGDCTGPCPADGWNNPGFTGYQPGFNPGYTPGYNSNFTGYAPGFNPGYNPNFTGYAPGYQGWNAPTYAGWNNPG